MSRGGGEIAIWRGLHGPHRQEQWDRRARTPHPAWGGLFLVECNGLSNVLLFCCGLLYDTSVTYEYDINLWIAPHRYSVIRLLFRADQSCSLLIAHCSLLIMRWRYHNTCTINTTTTYYYCLCCWCWWCCCLYVRTTTTECTLLYVVMCTEYGLLAIDLWYPVTFYSLYLTCTALCHAHRPHLAPCSRVSWNWLLLTLTMEASHECATFLLHARWS